MTFLYAHDNREREKARTRWVCMEEKHEERLKDERNTEGVGGHKGGCRIKMKSALMAQPCAS